MSKFSISNVNYFDTLVAQQLNKEAVLSILLATFTGFGAVMCGAYILIEFLKWRRRWLGSQEVVLPH